jgi:hypothetical protein
LCPREAVVTVEEDPLSSLDVQVLTDRLLRPVLGIECPRTDSRMIYGMYIYAYAHSHTYGAQVSIINVQANHLFAHCTLLTTEPLFAFFVGVMGAFLFSFHFLFLAFIVR